MSEQTMSGDIIELKSTMTSPISTSKDHLNQDIEEKTTATVLATEPLLNDYISVSDVIQRPSFYRRKSASTFLCPDYIPGKSLMKCVR